MDYVMKLSKINKITTNINKLDKKIWKENSITQQQLAKLLNITHSTIIAYKNGKTLILTAFVIEICKKYNYSLDWLYKKIKE